MLIKPTIGRVVWFRPEGSNPGDQPLAALIAYVHSDTFVNLAVFSSEGRMTEPNTTSVLLYHGEGERPEAPFCEWMPYQQGQAAKTEALEKQLEEKK